MDQRGAVLDILVQERKDTEAATAFIDLLLGEYVVPDKIVMGQLARRSAVKTKIMALEDMKHVFVPSEARLNKIVQNSRQPTSRREAVGVKQQEKAQTLLPSLNAIRQHFRTKKHRMRAADYRREVVQRFRTWSKVAGRRVEPVQHGLIRDRIKARHWKDGWAQT